MMAAILSAAAVLGSIQPGEVAAVIGPPRWGKTRVVQQAQRESWPASLIVDPNAGLDRAQGARHKRTPWPGPCGTALDLLRERQRLAARTFHLVITGRSRDKVQLARDVERVINLVWLTRKAGRGPQHLVVVLEESGQYSRLAHEAILDVASSGGHIGVSLVCIVQSLFRLAKDARRHVQLVIAAGPQSEDDDKRSLQRRCGRRFAEAVEALTPTDAPLWWRLGDRTWS